MDSKTLKFRLKDDFLAKIAFWQMMSFIMLLCAIWANEFWDFSLLFFGVKTISTPSIFRLSTLSILVIISAIITVGHTYIQHKYIIHGLLKVCPQCHKVEIDNQHWQNIEDYVTKYSLAAMSHGFCPKCASKMLEDK